MCEPKPGPRCAADTRESCNDAQCAYRQAHPEGPPVNPVASAQAGFDVHHFDDDAVTIGALDIEDGDSLILSDYELGGGTPFRQIEIVPDEDGYSAVASIPFDFTEVVPGDYEGSSDDYLNERHEDIAAFLADNYGAELGGSDSWEGSEVEFAVPLDAEKDTTANILERCETEPAIRLHNELNGGYGTRPFGAQLAEHLRNRDEEIDEAAGSAEIAAVWTAIGEGEDGEPQELDRTHSVEDFTPEARAQMRRQVADFTRENRALIAQAREVAASNGKSFDANDVGHNLVLSRNHHGTGFWDRDLGPVGDELHAKAEALGEQQVEVGDDGKLHLFGGK